MIRKVARYQVREDKVSEIKEAIKELVEAVAENEPGTFYDTYYAEDNTSFVHFMSFVDREAEEKHRNAPYTKKFYELLRPACETDPEIKFVVLVHTTRESKSGSA